MIVVAQNLAGIVTGLKLCDEKLIEEFSLTVRLGRRVRWPRRDQRTFVYGTPYTASDFFDDEAELTDGLTLSPHDAVLACSQDEYTMPPGYFGLIQTKGSLARAFVSTTCNDGQVEPGYRGRVTLEITNVGPLTVNIPVEAPVAQLFIFRCSTEVSKTYAGRYQNATGPTIPKFV
jgi:dCTP deaminase